MNSQAPMFSRTGGSDFPDKLKLLVSGPPKSGKTALIGTMPNVIIADTEPHANNLQSVAHLNLPYQTIASTDDLQRLRLVLSDDSLRKQAAESLGMTAIESVAIDTLDTLQQIMKKERMRDQRQSQFLRDDWGWLKEELAKIVEAFCALPLHVAFVVHTKTKEIGQGEDARTVVLPGLEGSLDAQIAGMVGYSLLSFRKQEIRPDGSPYTKYWLRAEGDETYDFLGNRAAGRLPDIIEPHFSAIYDAAMADRPKAQPEQVRMPQVQQTQPAGNRGVAQDSGHPSEPAQQQPEQQGQQQGQQDQQQAKAPDDDPINAAAITHVKKVYDACGLTFPEEIIKARTLGEARNIVRTWQAVQADEAEGKTAKGATAVGEMVEYLRAMEWLSPKDDAGGARTAKQVEPKADGTIEQVIAYVGGEADPDPARVQEAYDKEMARKPKPRSGLVGALERMGAKTQAAQSGQASGSEAPAEARLETRPEEARPEARSESQSPEKGAEEGQQESGQEATESEAVGNVQRSLGGEIVTDQSREDRPCQGCGNAVDDLDIARLSEGRFGKWLCVQCYVAEGKRPREAANA